MGLLSLLRNYPGFIAAYNDKAIFRLNSFAWVTIAVPLITFTVSRVRHFESGSMDYYYENHWWNWGGTGYYNGGGNEYSSEDRYPWWWFWDSDEDKEKVRLITIMIVYAYMLIWFVGMTIYGVAALHNGKSKDVDCFRVALTYFANLSFISCIFVGGMGAVEENDNEHGWYGQVSVLLFLSCVFWVVHGLIFSVWLRNRSAELEAKEIEQYGDPLYDPPPANIKMEVSSSYHLARP